MLFGGELWSASTVVIGVDGVQGRSKEGMGSIYGSLFVQMESFCQVCVISSQIRPMFVIG